MRPVNLIPPEERRGDRAVLRTGSLPYVLLGALGLGLIAVTVLVMVGNTVKEREAEVANLEAQEKVASAKADALAPYAEFAQLSETRDATVTSLANSRFDWERVLRELALVIPSDVWLITASGTVSPEVQLQSGAALPGRDQVAGPALELIGCGASHEAVAGFVAALRDIDGVTRVGISSSERSDTVTSTASEEGPASTGSTDDCRTRDFIARFEVIAAFDAVPEPADPTVPTTPAPAGDVGGEVTAAAPVQQDAAATGETPGVVR